MGILRVIRLVLNIPLQCLVLALKEIRRKQEYQEEGLDYDIYWRWRKRGWEQEAKRNKGSKQTPSIQERFKIFSDWAPEGSSVLDIGCGSGKLMRYLVENKSCKVLGIDISEEAAQLCKEKGVNALVEDITKDSFELKQDFDIVILSEIVEHLANPEGLIEKIKPHTNYIFLSLPNIGFFPYRLRLLFGRFPVHDEYHPSEHLRYWTYKDFKDWLRFLDLEILDVKSSNGMLYLKDLFPNMFGFQMCFKVKPKEAESKL